MKWNFLYQITAASRTTDLCPPLQILDLLPDGYEIYEDFAVEWPQKSFLTVDNNRWVKSVTHQAETILRSEMCGK